LLKQPGLTSPVFSFIHIPILKVVILESEKSIGLGEGGKNEDDEYFNLLPTSAAGVGCLRGKVAGSNPRSS
jgi:hypothetical protein